MPKPKVTSRRPSENSYLTFEGEKYLFEIFYINDIGVSTISIDNFIDLEISSNFNSCFYKGKLTVRNEANGFDFIASSVDVPNLSLDISESGENAVIIHLKKGNIEKYYVFGVYDETNGVNGGIKVKNYYLVDFYLYYLSNNKTPFSTTNSTASNSIKQLLVNNFSESIINVNKWDPSGSSFSYSSNFSDSNIDALDYLVEKAYDKDGYPMLLLKNNNQFELVSIKDLYNMYVNGKSKNFVGNFSLIDNSYRPEKVSNVLAYPVENFSFVNQGGKQTLDRLVSHKVVHYEHKSGRFSVFSEDNSVENIHASINKDFLNNNSKINSNISERSKRNNYYNLIYSTRPDTENTRYEGRAVYIKNLMNLSTGLEIVSNGVLTMRVGSFANINHSVNNSNKLGKKVNGSWFVTEYTHKITGNTFTTSFRCTKFHESV